MSLQPGATILNGEFKILERVNHGAFGVVYRALDVNLNVERAIKMIRRDEDGVGSAEFKDFRNRFHLEAQLGAKLESRNAQHLVRTYALRESEGKLYLIMEFMPGGSLADKLKNGALPLDDCLRIAKDVAAGLAEVHAMDVVHRDLKPSNILFDAQGAAKVADLGLAQIPGGMSQRSALGSAASAHPGTPAYMSPEQRETTDYLTPASDVYTFGLVLFEMLTGRHYKNVAPDEVFNAFKPQPAQKMQGLLKRCVEQNPSARPFDGDKLLAELDHASQQSGNAKFFIGIAALASVLVIFIFLFLNNPPTPQPTITLTPVLFPGATSTAIATLTPLKPQNTDISPTRIVTLSPYPNSTSATSSATDIPTPKGVSSVSPQVSPTQLQSVTGLFKNLWQSYQSRLGNPLQGNLKDREFGPYNFSEMSFQNGHMFGFYGGAKRVIWVVVNAISSTQKIGHWKAYPSVDWKQGVDPEFYCGDASSYPKIPKWDMNKVWCDDQEVRTQLGEGTGSIRDFEQESRGSSIYRLQEFEGGFIFRDSDGWTKQMAYVFFNDGTFAHESYINITPKSLDSNFFESNFDNGKVDTSQWNILQMPDLALVKQGVLSLSSSQSKFPFLHTVANPFPKSGDFELTIRFRYPQISECGVGIVASSYTTPPGMFAGTGQDKNYRLSNDKNGISLGVWQDRDNTKGIEMQFRLDGNILDKQVKPSTTEWKTLKISYINSQYRLEIDANSITSYSTTHRLNSIWLGHPADVGFPCSWSSLDVDWIQIK